MQEYSCLIVGDKKVGKTVYTKRFFADKGRCSMNMPYCPTNCEQITPVTFSTSDGPVKFNLYDGGYNSNPDCAVIMFDLNNRKSWTNVEVYHCWLRAQFSNVPIVICGNQTEGRGDTNEVKPSEISHFVTESHKHLSPVYFEINVRTRYGIDKPFQHLWRKLRFPERSNLDLKNCGLYFH